ncbi:MAG: response regulator [Deltaproteobacteria bacterium]
MLIEHSSGPRVLAIDDKSDNLVALRAVLAVALPGCVLLTATDGERGLELARSADPDVVLLEIVMPGMDGFEVCARMKADERLREIPVVFLTALGTARGARIEALRAGAEGFLAKPPDEFELAAQIRAMTRLREAARERRRERDELEALVLDRTRQVREELEERRRAEADRELLATAIEQVAETIVITDRDGKIVYANPAFEAISGYPISEAIGLTPRVLKSGVHDAAFYEALWRTISSGRNWTGRIVNRRKDGKLYTEDVTISPVRAPDGQISSYVAVKRDITRDLALEAQLLQAQKMESIGRLAGGVAHDFNNILAVILASVRFALEAVREEGELRSDLREIETAAERAASLTRQLLAFSRKQVPEPEVLDLNVLIQGVEKMLRRVVGEDVSVIPDLAPQLGRVRADPVQIQQVIVNLAVNARDAMPDGGTLTLRTRNVEPSHEPGDTGSAGASPRVLLQIIDTGVGMEEETLDRLFEPFFTTKELGKGTGLGLSIAYGFVEQSGGSIRVSSKPGQGTVVDVILPRCESAANEAAPKPEDEDLSGSETILVVEDDASVRELIRRTLAKAGYAVLAAEDGPSGLALCLEQEGRVELVLTDVVMPGMNGRVFRDRLLEECPGMPVLFMSGYSDGAFGAEAGPGSDLNFISKPFSDATLLRRIRRILDGGGVAPVGVASPAAAVR